MEKIDEKAKVSSNDDIISIETIYKTLDELMYIAEERECLDAFLDSFDVPRESNGEPLSLVGRVAYYKFGCFPEC